MKPSAAAALFDRGRKVGLVAALLGAAYVFVSQVRSHVALENWLFWSYAEYWLACGVFTLSCWSAGDAVARALAPGARASERMVYALSSGLLVFFLAMFVGGLLGLYGRVLFFALPVVLILSGGRPFFRFARRILRHAAGTSLRRPPSLPFVLATLFGLFGIGLVYFVVLNPDNLAYDARWYHLPIAEHYAAQGGIRRFPEGWYPGALPHLASVAFTWAFLLPGSDLFDRVELCAHLELVLFLWTLASIPVLVRACTGRMDRGPSARSGVAPPSGLASWAALFLFPGIFLYDSSLCGVADHVAAFWGVPVLLALLRGLRKPGARSGVLLAAAISGALLTKYQGIYIAVFPVLTVVFALMVSALPLRSPFRGGSVAIAAFAASALGAGLLLTSPHWLKNWVYYGDPVYPFLFQHFRPRPWTEDAPDLFHRVFTASKGWAPTGTLVERLRESLGAVLTFSFVPHDWPFFHKEIPVFGSLFTLSLVPLLLFRNTRRIWLVASSALVGVFVWYFTYHQDRYLQALVPWMAVVTAVAVRRTWAGSLWPKLSLAMLIGLQAVWGGDVYFFPTHGVLRASIVNSTIDFMAKGFRGLFAQRRALYGAVPRLGATLPRGAKVLFHDGHFHLGLGTMSVSDVAPWQGGISYARLRSPALVYDLLRSYGVTHLMWGDALERDTMAGDFVFLAFATRYGQGQRSDGDMRLATLTPKRPPDTSWLEAPAAVFVCAEGYAPGQYRLGDLTVPSTGSRVTPNPKRRAVGAGPVDSVVASSEFLALDPHCYPSVTPVGFVRVGQRKKGTQLWIRQGEP